MKIALTGGIACGKSTLAKFLRELGICLLDADDVVHELEGVGGEAVPLIVERFGRGVLAADGSIDRVQLARRVFGDSDASTQRRAELEGILFPLVRTRLLDFVSSQSSSPLRIAVIPLLFESHWEADYDIILTITSTEEQQIHRMMHTRGYTRAQTEARLMAQMPVAEKAARADFVIVNDSTPENLREKARQLFDWLKERMVYEHGKTGKYSGLLVSGRTSSRAGEGIAG